MHIIIRIVSYVVRCTKSFTTLASLPYSIFAAPAQEDLSSASSPADLAPSAPPQEPQPPSQTQQPPEFRDISPPSATTSFQMPSPVPEEPFPDEIAKSIPSTEDVRTVVSPSKETSPPKKRADDQEKDVDMSFIGDDGEPHPPLLTQGFVDPIPPRDGGVSETYNRRNMQVKVRRCDSADARGLRHDWVRKAGSNMSNNVNS